MVISEPVVWLPQHWNQGFRSSVCDICYWIGGYLHFEETHHLHLQIFMVHADGLRSTDNTGNILQKAKIQGHCH